MITKPKGTKDIYGLDAKRWQYVTRKNQGIKAS